MDIPEMSIGLSEANTMNSVGIALLAKEFDMMETVGQELVDMIDRSSAEHSVYPNLGGTIDLMV